MASQLFDPSEHSIFYLIDLSSYLLRAYHAVAPLSSPSGEPTHAVHGMVTMIERLLKSRKPKLVGVAMDSGRQTFRKELYPEYKANRPPAPDDLRVQIRRAEEFIDKAGFAKFKEEGVEADDLIASAAEAAKAKGYKVVIVSSDKDLMQLVDQDTLLWDTLRNKVFGEAEVTERFDVTPTQLGDLLALMGDSSDNIPGVPSVGAKTAAKLLSEYQTLDGIYEGIASIKRKKLQETLRDNEDKARLSRQLVELKRDCAVDLAEDNISFPNAKNQDLDALRALFRELGFHQKLTSLDAGSSPLCVPGQQTAPAAASSAAPKQAPPATGADGGNAGQGEHAVQSEQAVQGKQGAQSKLGASDDQAAPSEQEAGGRHLPVVDTSARAPSSEIRLVTTQAELEQLIQAAQRERVALELHTTRPDRHRGDIIAACLEIEDQTYYLPFGHRVIGTGPQLQAKESLRQLFSGVVDADWICHDEKRLRVLLAGLDEDLVVPEFFDVMLGAYLLSPEQNQSLESLATHVNIEVPDYDLFSKEKRKKRDWDELEVAMAAQLAQLRVMAVYQLVDNQNALLGAYGLGKLLREVEGPLARQLAKMEVLGVRINSKRLQELGKQCEASLSELEVKAHEAAGKSFNVNSPRQLEEILFDELGLKPLKRTKTSRSTDAQTLEALKEEHPLPELILQIRQVAKLKSTYIDSLPQLADSEGRVHGSWEQAVAATGRISSSEPNLQNIPIRSALGQEIRGCFEAKEGHLLVAADYSQIELRVLAHLSQDERLLSAFQEEQDIHLRTAMEIFEVPADQVDREMRSRAKAVNFGVIYGQGESGLSAALGIDRKTAKDFIQRYFERYQGVTEFMERTLEAARQGHAVESLLGRRRKVPDINNGHRGRRLAAERIAMNMPIQGSAADILKLAMLRLATPVTPGARMILTVHDELVFEVPEAEVPEARVKIQEEMQNAYALDVPLTVSVDVGKTWTEAH